MIPEGWDGRLNIYRSRAPCAWRRRSSRHSGVDGSRAPVAIVTSRGRVGLLIGDRGRGRAAPDTSRSRFGENVSVPAYTVNRNAVRHAKRLIDGRQYVLRSRWQDVQPRAREQNAFLKAHSWEEYAGWHLGLTEGAAEETKARHAFVYGDFRRLHRMGLIACHYRAAEWRHKEIELAAHELLQYLDRRIG